MNISGNINFSSLRWRNINYSPIKFGLNNVKLKQLNKDEVSFGANVKLNAIDRINRIQGNAFDSANKIKEILLEDLGLPKDCIQIEVIEPPEGDGNYCDYFDMATGNIILHRDSYSTPQKVAVTIRHELEHFRQCLGYVKNFGLEEYKKYVEESGNIEEIEQNCPNVSTKFNKELWGNENLYSLVDITKEQCVSYRNSIIARNKVDKMPESTYKDLKNLYMYYIDPSEQEAYEAQDELARKLGIEVDEKISPVFMQKFAIIEKKINEILSKKSYLGKDSALIFEKAYRKSTLKTSLSIDNCLSNKDIKKLFDCIINELDNFLNL